jgi:hypothetical protein
MFKALNNKATNLQTYISCCCGILVSLPAFKTYIPVLVPFGVLTDRDAYVLVAQTPLLGNCYLLQNASI